MEHITHTGAPHLPIPYGGCHFGQSPQLFPLEVLAGWLGKGMPDRASPYSTVDCKLQIVQLKPDPDVFLAWADRASPSVPSLSLSRSLSLETSSNLVVLQHVSLLLIMLGGYHSSF